MGPNLECFFPRRILWLQVWNIRHNCYLLIYIPPQGVLRLMKKLDNRVWCTHLSRCKRWIHIEYISGLYIFGHPELFVFLFCHVCDINTLSSVLILFLIWKSFHVGCNVIINPVFIPHHNHPLVKNHCQSNEGDFEEQQQEYQYIPRHV